jgi:hypothetical protein
MATSRHIPEPKSSPSQKDRRQFKQKETKVTKVRKPSSLAPLSVAASVPEFSTPIFLCCLCYLLFQCSLSPCLLLAAVDVDRTATISQKDRRQFEQKETKVTKVRRSYSRAPLSPAASVPEFPALISLCYLCYLLFQFSLFSSVECEC